MSLPLKSDAVVVSAKNKRGFGDFGGVSVQMDNGQFFGGALPDDKGETTRLGLKGKSVDLIFLKR